MDLSRRGFFSTIVGLGVAALVPDQVWQFESGASVSFTIPDGMEFVPTSELISDSWSDVATHDIKADLEALNEYMWNHIGYDGPRTLLNWRPDGT